MEPSSQSEVLVNMKDAHLYCGGCGDATASPLEPMWGVVFQCGMEHGTECLRET